jgi:hypothetical protein
VKLIGDMKITTASFCFSEKIWNPSQRICVTVFGKLWALPLLWRRKLDLMCAFWDVPTTMITVSSASSMWCNSLAWLPFRLRWFCLEVVVDFSSSPSRNGGGFPFCPWEQNLTEEPPWRLFVCS